MPGNRYAIFHLPEDDELFEAGSCWLGWNARATRLCADTASAIAAERRAALVARPRRYGFHATIVAPFHTNTSQDDTVLGETIATICAAVPPQELSGLELTLMGRFLALTPVSQPQALTDLAMDVVRQTAELRAPLTQADLARRSASARTQRQKENLHAWGYAHVGADYRFHLTLTGPVAPSECPEVRDRLSEMFAPLLARPYPLTRLAMMRENTDGVFHLVRECLLGG